MEALPFQSAALIEQLDKEIPERCPDPTWTEREIWVYTGKRQLINSLLLRLKEAEDELLEK